MVGMTKTWTRSALVLAVLLSIATGSALAAAPPMDEKDDRDVRNVEASRGDKKHQDPVVIFELPRDQKANGHLKSKVVAQKFKTK
ncbi:hypothetical protein MTO96_030259 [Rhipicephalus appendiculatus]